MIMLFGKPNVSWNSWKWEIGAGRAPFQADLIDQSVLALDVRYDDRRYTIDPMTRFLWR